jgi:hypothetical protein
VEELALVQLNRGTAVSGPNAHENEGDSDGHQEEKENQLGVFVEGTLDPGNHG